MDLNSTLYIQHLLQSECSFQKPRGCRQQRQERQKAFSRTRKVWSDHRANGGQVKGGGEGQIKQEEGKKVDVYRRRANSLLQSNSTREF